MRSKASNQNRAVADSCGSGQFRMPAEWEPHEATWIGWPHNSSDWPRKFAAIPWVYGEIARQIAPGEVLRILVNSAAHEARAKAVLKRAGVALSRFEFFHFPTNRGWMRDSGPIFVQRTAPGAAGRCELAVNNFHFTAWAKYPDWKLDNAIPQHVAEAYGYPLVNASAKGARFVLEGGSIDVNGRGTLITTEECLLDSSVQPRNPGLSRTEIEAALRAHLGVTRVLWLGRGIAGDDTHGHVDDLCRFTGPGTVVLCSEADPQDSNYRPLQENRERLEAMRLEDGSKLEIISLPMPAPLYFAGQRLPATYANFYIANSAVLVPTFNDPKDRLALGILSELFRNRTVTGIHAVDLLWGLGTVHCLTQQQPRSAAPANRRTTRRA